MGATLALRRGLEGPEDERRPMNQERRKLNF
jgi:hypothetical protein